MTDEQIAILKAVSREAERCEWKYCKCSRVLAATAELLGVLDDDSRRCLFTEGSRNTPKIEELYGILITLTRDTDLLEGQGNLGSTDCGPADPMFTECALTEHGETFITDCAINPQAELDVSQRL